MELVIGEPGVIGVGYQGQTIDQFIGSLVDMRVTCVVDVRLTPLSRKFGFSKGSLARALASRGISYEHTPALGNPHDNRRCFAGDDAGARIGKVEVCGWARRRWRVGVAR
jgi:uncharacterized protein (DUF488 family)